MQHPIKVSVQYSADSKLQPPLTLIVMNFQILTPNEIAHKISRIDSIPSITV